MSDVKEIKIPDIGDDGEVEVIELLVEPGQSVEAEESLLTLESDKASMEVPSPMAGTIKDISVKVGDKVATGHVIGHMEVSGSTESKAESKPETKKEEPKKTDAPAPTAKTAVEGEDMHAEVVVIGAGPGGYTAAFRAADLGKKVILIERYPSLGGVCLNVGCIPSKALLHAAKVIDEVDEMAAHGVSFSDKSIDLDKLRGWKEKVVGRLTGGLKQLAKQRKVTVVHGVAKFISGSQIEVDGEDGKKIIGFDNAVIAAGSEPTKIPVFPHEDPRLIDSTGALELADIPKRLLVVGGGIIGLEMATVYHALGTKVTIVEFMPGLIPPADRDIVKPLAKRIGKRYENIFLNTKVTKIEAEKKGLVAYFDGKDAPESDTFDKVLVSVGRRPNGASLGLENAGVKVDERGFVPVDKQQKTNVANIFAIGDIVGQPMLAHKAVHEGKVAAEVASGMKSYFDARVIPSVAYTDPEVAWVGITEQEAKDQGIKVEKGVFPWAASGRSLSVGRDEGITKTLYDPETDRILGAGIVGPNAGELIAEVALAIEMGCVAEDIGLTVHPHPTLSETVAMSAEAFEGTLTDLYIPKKK